MMTVQASAEIRADNPALARLPDDSECDEMFVYAASALKITVSLKAGYVCESRYIFRKLWIPAFAGMTAGVRTPAFKVDAV